MPQPFRRVSRDFRSLTRPIPSTRRTQWSPEEEEALRKGVKKYGAGKWRFIQKDPVLGKILNQRSNVDLKVSPRATAATRPFPTADSRPPEVGGVPCHRDTARPPDFSPRCENWCANSGKDWATKCAWGSNVCSTCSACPSK